MLTVDLIDVHDRRQVRRFSHFPFKIYGKGHPYWVPPILIDVEASLNPKKHPFYEHSEADFFMAVRDGRDVGRIAVIVNNHFNQCHNVRKASFWYFECEDDPETAAALFERAFGWARSRGLDTMIGPKGFGPVDGYGLLVDGFDQRAMMTMTTYNPPYYPALLEGLGFEKEVDFISCYADTSTFQTPDRIHSIAERVVKRGTLSVKTFETKSELKQWGARIGKAYNQAFVNNWEYVPLTERELTFVIDNLLTIADPRLIKIILHEEDVVGFLFAFPDVSAAIQRSGGRLLPFGIIDMLLEVKRTDWVAVNGMGILEEYQGRGGNALLYSEMVKTIQQKQFRHADMVLVAETAENMRADLINLGGRPYMNHRVYHKSL